MRKKQRFLLLNSPIFWEESKENEQYLSPLGLGYIATYLEKSGIDVVLIDCVKENKSVSEIINFLNEEQPEFVGTNIFTQNYDIVKYIIESLKFDCECFIGGQVVKSIYHDILHWNIKNRLYIIIGEGEFIIPSLVTQTCKQKAEVRDDFKQVYRVDKNSAYFPENISDIFLNRKYFKDEIVTNHYGDREAAIVTSRGCSFDCAFCGGARSLNTDVPIRIRTEESVVIEIKEILSEHPDIQSIRILDDLFLRSPKSIENANQIFLNFPNLNWRGMVHALSLSESIEKIKELKSGGCKELFLGIESGSDTIRKHIQKLGTVEDVIRVSQEILKCGIDLKGYFIYGFPEETKEDFQKTYELAVKIKEISINSSGDFRTSVFQFRPYHGTKLYNEIVKKNGIIHACKINDTINLFKGREQFNFEFGNYSNEPDGMLNDYIIKTQELTEERRDD